MFRSLLIAFCLSSIAFSATVSILSKANVPIPLILEDRVDSIPAFNAFMDRLEHHTQAMNVPITRPQIQAALSSAEENVKGDNISVSRSKYLAGEEECRIVEMSGEAGRWLVRVMWSSDLDMKAQFLVALVQVDSWMRLFHFRAQDPNSFIMLEEIKPKTWQS
jgi:hypothetical protein